MARAQKGRGSWLAEKASPFRASFCAHQLQLAEPGGAVVSGVVDPMYSSGFILQRRWPESRYPGISRFLERRSQTLGLDRYRGIDYGEALSLPANAREDSARLYPAAQQKERAITCILI